MVSHQTTSNLAIQASGRLWDGAAIMLIALFAASAWFGESNWGPWPVTVITLVLALATGLVYWPRQRRWQHQSRHDWYRSGLRAFDAAVIGSAVAAGLLSYVDTDPMLVQRTATKSAVMVGLLILLVTAYLTVLRRQLANTEPASVRRWLVFVAVSAAVVGALGWLTPTAAMVQIAAYGVLWMALPPEGNWFLGLFGTLTVAGFGALGLTVSEGLRDTILTQLAALAASLVMGFWLNSAWRWGGDRAELLVTLQQAQTSLALIEREAGALAERERLARDIHDTIAQALVGVIMTTQSIQRLSDDTALPEEVIKRLRVVADLAEEALAEARTLVAVGARVDDSGPIDQVLERLASRFSRETGIEVFTEVSLPGSLAADTRLVLLRSAQEGLANTRKHSGATQVRLFARMEGTEAVVEVVDNGVGPGNGTGFGLASLRDQVAVSNGSVSLSEIPDGGARLTVRSGLVGNG